MKKEIKKKEINIILGQRVKELRKQKGYTRESFSEALSVSPRFIANIECGEAGVSISTLKNISNILNISTDYLLGISNPGDTELSRQLAINKINSLDDKYLDHINTILDCVTEITEL